VHQDVVDLVDSLRSTGRREGALHVTARLRGGLDVHNDIGAGDHPLDFALDRLGDVVGSLQGRRPARGDRDVGEEAAPTAANSDPAGL
jgi:hypothetical protein